MQVRVTCDCIHSNTALPATACIVMTAFHTLTSIHSDGCHTVIRTELFLHLWPLNQLCEATDQAALALTMSCPAGYYIPTPYGYAAMTYTYDSGVHVYEFFTQSLVGAGRGL
jgi:hypothetical protein